jgi:hypothetical protein
VCSVTGAVRFVTDFLSRVNEKGPLAGSRECGGETSVCGATELVS